LSLLLNYFGLINGGESPVDSDTFKYDESKKGYAQDVKDFDREFDTMLKESIIKFKDFL
jgi:hypothetical protein